MPAKRKTAADTTAPRSNQPADPAPEAVAADPDVEPTTAAAPVSDDGDGDGDAVVEAAPLNRAERRARGKQQTAAQPAHRGKVVGGKGPAGSQRMWANRRSG